MWAIDGSVLRFSAYGNYLMYSCMYGVTYQSICLQKLSSDYVSLTGDIHIISSRTRPGNSTSTPSTRAPRRSTQTARP